MKVGILTDGKYGERAFANISTKFPCEWIQLDEVPSNIILDDYELKIPNCDLYISYLRHPDQIFALAELNKPTLLGINFGPGFLRQVQEINTKVLAFPTMCSLEPNTNIPEIDEFAGYFGRPIYDLKLTDGTVTSIVLKRSSPCGSSKAGLEFITGKAVSEEILQDFALHVCYECRAPRFSKTCDKKLAGMIHLRALFANLIISNEFDRKKIQDFIIQIEGEFCSRLNSEVKTGCLG